MRRLAVLILTLLSASASAEVERGFVGVLFARDAVTLASEVNGKLLAIHARIGDSVQAGQTIMTLDSPGLGEDISSTRASIHAAKADVSKSKAELDEISRSLERRENTVDIFSEDEIEALKTRKIVREAAYETAKSTVTQREATLQELLRRQASLAVKAPFAGKVAACYHEPGEYVSVGMDMVRLVGTGDLWVRFAVSEDAIAWLQNGAAITVRPDGGETILEGIVRHISPEIDAAIGIIVAEAIVTTPNVNLPIGSVVRVRKAVLQTQR